MRIGCLKPIFEREGLELNRWNRKFSMKRPDSGLVCIRGFSSCKNKPKNIVTIYKTLDRICEESKKYLSKHSIMTKYKQLSLKDPSAARSLCSTIVISPPSGLPSFKSCPTEKYITPSLSCHNESSNLKCRNMLSSPYSPLCPISIKKPSLKIYKKHPVRLKYTLKQKYLLQEPGKLYCPSYPRSYSSCSRSVSQQLQEICKNSLKLQKNKEILTHHDLPHLISLHRVHWRGFHNSSFCLTNSNSVKLFACKKMDEICKSTEVKKTNQRDQSYSEKSDVCHQKKIKCDKRQQPTESKAKSKPKTERKIVDPACKKTCLARSKCEWPQTVPPPKMDYVKVTCLPPKFTKPNPCPSKSEHLQKDSGPHIEAKRTNIQKKQVCVPPPLPKPPFGPTALCPCLPPRKIHPGPCSYYERKEVPKPSIMQPCPLKKKYPCPTGIHYCPLQKKPCNLRQDTGCEHKKKKTSTP